MTLRELLAGGQPIVVPGAYDALSARLVEQAGFPAVYMTGFGASASLLGRPDVGLLPYVLLRVADDAAYCAVRVRIQVASDSNPGPLPFTQTQDVEVRNRLPGNVGCG